LRDASGLPPAQYRTDACEKFAQTERLCHVVVSPIPDPQPDQSRRADDQ
jgi:hypothetical protein